MNAEDFEKKLFPLEEWNAQRNSPHGDKTNAANKFVSVNAPFGSRMIVQDGKTLFNISILFLTRFIGVVFCPKHPNHRVSKLILKLLGPKYQQFIVESLTILSKIVKPNIPNVPQLAFKEDYSGVLAIASEKSTPTLNT